MVVKVKILSKCSYCDGQAYLPSGMDLDIKGEKYMRYLSCPKCKGSGLSGKWINLAVFQQILENVECPHKHVSRNGRHHFSADEVWDGSAPSETNHPFSTHFIKQIRAV